VRIRKATASDIPRIEELMRESTSTLGARYYDERQTASAMEQITVPDRQLIDDETYFVVEDDDVIVGCGGWSKRAKLYTGSGSTDPRLLDPATEAARVRAMFVLSSHARRGIGRMVLEACEDEARRAGFRSMELMATLPGEPFYLACGYHMRERTDIQLNDGVILGGAMMEKAL
jgi:GNAT superfamily N-acetyltransferase